jgi:hypothetical protein
MASIYPLILPHVILFMGKLKDKVYRTNTHTEEELKENIQRKIWKFLTKNFFGCIPNYLSGTHNVCMYRDSTSTPPTI